MLMTVREVRELARKIMKMSLADATEVLVSSESSALSAAGIAYAPENQRWRSTSLQRPEQNGRKRSAAGLPQVGQGFPT
jgi:hypothetical protein